MDKNLAREKLAQLRKYVSELRGLLDQPVEDYRADPRSYHAGERLLELIVEVGRGIAKIVLEGDPRFKTLTYATMFGKLAEIEVLPESLADRLEPLGETRNIVVHDYPSLETEPEAIYDLLKARLDDYERFALFVKQYLDQQPDETDQD